MATNFLELATTLKYLGAKWLPETKLILHPDAVLFRCINPLAPEPAITGCAKTIPQMPVLTVTACKKACEDNCLSYPP